VEEFMSELIANIGTLVMLVFLQAVLGFDNLLYISLESKRVEPDKQQYVRRVGIAIAIVLRIVLLFVVLMAIENLTHPLFEINIPGWVEAVQVAGDSAAHGAEHAEGGVPASHGGFTLHALVVLLGGMFILYTALKEITHMLSIEDIGGEHGGGAERSVGNAIFWIVIMNLVFSFDSILSAIALTHVFWVLAVSVIASGVMMMVLADKVSEFLQKNRMYEVLGLFILFIVGVMLISEGGHLANLTFFGEYKIEPMAKSTFYFVIIILVLIDVAQGRYQKKIDIERTAQHSARVEQPQD
jgi:predicted tellurium resistance membrane protein TerC